MKSFRDIKVDGTIYELNCYTYTLYKSTLINITKGPKWFTFHCKDNFGSPTFWSIPNCSMDKTEYQFGKYVIFTDISLLYKYLQRMLCKINEKV